MKKFKVIILAALVGLMSSSAFAVVDVDGYYRKNGTYVAPHQRSNPDGNPYNNYRQP
jgi:hypothetical protein